MKVSYQEPPSIKVGEFLLSKGFNLASSVGIASNLLVGADSLGILRNDPEAKPRKYLFGLITREPRRGFLGTIWFNNSARGASAQNWIFEAHGRKHIELARQLAEEIASTFNVNIVINLASDESDVEAYMSDYNI